MGFINNAKANEASRIAALAYTEGRRVLTQQRKMWAAFVDAVRRVTGEDHG